MLALDAEQARGVPGSRPDRNALVLTALAAAVVLALAACSGGRPVAQPAPPGAAGTSLPTAPAAVTQTLSETGSSLMAPLFARWAPAYHARFPQVTLRIATSSSGVGISSAAADATDIGASDAYLSPAALARDLRAFLSWALTSGTAQLGPVNFQPLPTSVMTQAQAQIAEITG